MKRKKRISFTLSLLTAVFLLAMMPQTSPGTGGDITIEAIEEIYIDEHVKRPLTGENEGGFNPELVEYEIVAPHTTWRR